MKIEFTKMNGAANDFVFIDDLRDGVRLTEAQVHHVCDRRRGVGADGLILLRPSRDADFHMQYYNSDGFPAEMCGNGARCAALFAAQLGLGIRKDAITRLRFATDSGPIVAEVAGDRVSLSMMDAKEMSLNVPAQVARDVQMIHFIVVGTRHAVVFVDDVKSLTGEKIMRLGRTIRHHDAFAPVGANVNFASVDRDNQIHLRTYEKGVEAETYACGTGSVAAAVILAHMGKMDSPARVFQWSGDQLVVSFDIKPKGAENVILEGPAAVNFKGSIEF